MSRKRPSSTGDRNCVSEKEEPSTATEKGDFVRSMTFTRMSRDEIGCCDCDECGPIQSAPEASKSFYRPLWEAIQQHKRQKQTEAIQRQQHRQLLNRWVTSNATFTLYEYILPVNAEPLIEYGVYPRIVYLESIDETSILQTLGTGIIGSAAEESERKELNWKKRNAYYVPSNDGKAIGYVHTVPKHHTEGNILAQQEDRNGLVSPAVLKVLKIQLGQESIGTTSTNDTNSTENEGSEVSKKLIEMAQRLQLFTFSSAPFCELSTDDMETFRSILQEKKC